MWIHIHLEIKPSETHKISPWRPKVSMHALWINLHRKVSLQRHIKSVHEGHQFQCSHCEYRATQKHYLQTHIKSLHEGLTFAFACTQCNYKAKWKNDLPTHIKSVHEGQTFSCTHCIYQTKWKHDLVKHKKKKHPSITEEYFEENIKIKTEDEHV